jgi:hypothetical protein
MTQQQLQTRLQQAENETSRLRQCVISSRGRFDIVLTCLLRVNEALMLGTAEQRHAAAAAAVAAVQQSSF